MESSHINLLLSQENLLLSERLAGIRTELSELAESSSLAQVAFENLQHLLVITQEDVDKTKQMMRKEEDEKNKGDNGSPSCIVAGRVVPTNDMCTGSVASTAILSDIPIHPNATGSVVMGTVITTESPAKISTEASVGAATVVGGKGDIKGRFFKFVDDRRRDYKEENALLRIKMMALSCQEAELRNYKSQCRVAMECYVKEHERREELQAELDKLTLASEICEVRNEEDDKSSSSSENYGGCGGSNEDCLGITDDSSQLHRIQSLTLLVDDYKTKIKKYKKKYEGVEKELASCRRMHQNLSSSCDKLNEDKEIAENKVMIMEDDIQHYRKENDSLIEKLKILSKKFKKVQEVDVYGKMEHAQQRILAVTNECEYLKQTIVKEKEQNDRLIKLVSKLQQEAQEAKNGRVDAENRARIAEIKLESLPDGMDNHPLAVDRDGVLMVGDQNTSTVSNITAEELSAEVDRLRRHVSKLLEAKRHLEEENVRLNIDFKRQLEECEKVAMNKTLLKAEKEQIGLSADKDCPNSNSKGDNVDTDMTEKLSLSSYEFHNNGITSSCCSQQHATVLLHTSEGSSQNNAPVTTGLLRFSLGILFNHWKRLLNNKSGVLTEEKREESDTTIDVTTVAFMERELDDMRCELRKKEYLMEELQAELRSMSQQVKDINKEKELILFLNKKQYNNKDDEEYIKAVESSSDFLQQTNAELNNYSEKNHLRHMTYSSKGNTTTVAIDENDSSFQYSTDNGSDSIVSPYVSRDRPHNALELQKITLEGLLDESHRENQVLRQELERQGAAMQYLIEKHDEHVDCSKVSGNSYSFSQLKSKLSWKSQSDHTTENRKLSMQLKNVQYLLEMKLTENMKLNTELDELRKSIESINTKHKTEEKSKEKRNNPLLFTEMGSL